VEPAVRFALSGAPTDVALARHVLRVTLADWDMGGDVADTAVLLLSEVVTNAVRHSPGPAEVEVALSETPGLRICVHDRGGDRPLPGNRPLPGGRQEVPLASEGGRGLFLLDALARSWGSRHEPGNGKQVWFELGA